MSTALLPGSTELFDAAKKLGARQMRKWPAADRAALKMTLEYVRRSYKTPGASFPRLVPCGMSGSPEIICGNHRVASFTTYEIASASEAIARSAAESCGLPV